MSDINGVIADPFEILCDHQYIQRKFAVIRLFCYIGYKLALHAEEALVDLVVIRNDLARERHKHKHTHKPIDHGGYPREQPDRAIERRGDFGRRELCDKDRRHKPDGNP